jgi:hypothetical protein
MGTTWIVAAVLALAFAVALALLLRRRPSAQPTPAPVEAESLASQPFEAAGRVKTARELRPDEIIIGESPSHAAVTIRSAATAHGYEKAARLDVRSGAFGRLAGLLQAAPTLLVAGGGAGKRLIEVVIDGKLTAAADGKGFRAIAMKGSRILHHARLLEVGKLQSVINAAAVWQVASVIVAQKHLADINNKMDEIKASIRGVSRFLDQQRKARIQSTYDYLAQVSQAMAAGELSSSVRDALEDCERDLMEIHRHLVYEFRRAVEEKVEHSETIGTGELNKQIAAKIEKLTELAGDLQMCLRTRVGGWHVLAAFPGEPRMFEARQASIQASCEEMRELATFMRHPLESEIAGMKAIFNRSSTLDKRRKALGKGKARAIQAVEAKADDVRMSMQETLRQLLLQNQPTRILVEIQRGEIVGARQALPARRGA